jgi:hypothetical protein
MQVDTEIANAIDSAPLAKLNLACADQDSRKFPSNSEMTVSPHKTTFPFGVGMVCLVVRTWGLEIIRSALRSASGTPSTTALAVVLAAKRCESLLLGVCVDIGWYLLSYHAEDVSDRTTYCQ